MGAVMKPDFDSFFAFRLSTAATRKMSEPRQTRGSSGPFVVTLLLAIVGLVVLIAR